jgi:sterol desaturase/sphingolipid hydroxylase (fatty acid hydroxylase superfamily)
MPTLEQIIGFMGGPTALFLIGSVYVSLVVGERLYYLATGRAYNDPDARCGVALNLINSVFNLILGIFVPFVLYLWVWENFRLVEVMPLWLALIAGFLWHDFAYYAEHRLGHRVGILWATHSVHHASNEFNHSVAARGFPTDGLMNAPWHIPAALLGVPPVAYVAVTITKQAFGIWNHASYVGQLGWAERWLCTPVIHKIHHANQPHYIDKNFGQVLLIWDRLFGSHAAYADEPVPGLVKPLNNVNPLKAQVSGLVWLAGRMRPADRWQDKLAYLWRPPEWSHDGVCRSDCPKYGVAAAAT